MYEEFGKNKMRHIDYDKVKRFAFNIQTDPNICASLDTEACGEGEAWEPTDEWITDMCRAFLNSAREAAKKERNSAFGGGRTEWDPKNPHSRPAAERRLSGGTPVGSPSARKASARRPTGDGPSNPFDTKLLSMMQGLSVPA